MDRIEYVTGIGELYAAEVLGEALANRWLELATDPDHKYKLALFLQLESGAKVRLRPLLGAAQEPAIFTVARGAHWVAGRMRARRRCLTGANAICRYRPETGNEPREGIRPR